MIEKLLALAPKTANCKLHFFVPFNFRAYSFLPVLQILIKFSNTSTCIMKDANGHADFSNKNGLCETCQKELLQCI